MKKLFSIFLLVVAMVLCAPCFAQPPQRLSYVDTEYILDQLPEWRSAQKQLDDAADRWKTELIRRRTELDKLKNDFQAEMVLLPEETRKKREDEITQKQKDYSSYNTEKFGPEGELFKKRQQLLKPIQDKVFSAIQDIAKENAQDFIFDKAGAVTILYTNPKYDRSDEVIERLKVLQKQQEKEDAKKELMQNSGTKSNNLFNQNNNTPNQNQNPNQNQPMQSPPGMNPSSPGGNPPGGQNMPQGLPPGGQPPQPH